MKTEKKKREFIALELQKYATEVGLGELGLTDGIIKNKIDTIKKTGKRLVNSVVRRSDCHKTDPLVLLLVLMRILIAN